MAQLCNFFLYHFYPSPSLKSVTSQPTFASSLPSFPLPLFASTASKMLRWERVFGGWWVLGGGRWRSHPPIPSIFALKGKEASSKPEKPPPTKVERGSRPRGHFEGERERAGNAFLDLLRGGRGEIFENWKRRGPKKLNWNTRLEPSKSEIWPKCLNIQLSKKALNRPNWNYQNCPKWDWVSNFPNIMLLSIDDLPSGSQFVHTSVPVFSCINFYSICCNTHITK